MSASSSHSTLLDEFFEGLTRNPRHLFLLIVLIGGFVFSSVSVLMGILIFIAIRNFIQVTVIVGLIGAILILGSVWIAGVGLHEVHLQNTFLYAALWHDELFQLKSPLLWLSALPYGLFLGAVLALLWRLVSPLQKELRRLGKGKLIEGFRSASPRRLQKALIQAPCTSDQNNTVLGVDRETARYACLADSDANLHTLVIGTTGSGKTTALANIIESATSRGYPLCYVDGKGDLRLAKNIESFAQQRKIPFHLFSMVGPSLSYNPLASGGFTSKKDRIIELRHWSEDHYRKLAEGYLQTVFKLLSQAEISINLSSLSQYMEPSAWYPVARSRQKPDWIKTIESLEQRRDSIESVIAEIHNITESELGHLFQENGEEMMTLERTLASGGIVYFCLQPLAFPAYAETLGKLIINDLKALLASQLTQNTPRKLFAIFDEFSVFAGDQIVHLINQGRGAGLHAILATQSLSDIQSKGGDALLGQVLNNVNNYVIQRQNYPADAEVLANVIGTRDVFVVTTRVSSDSSNVGMGSVRESKEFRVHPDEIKRLGLGEAILVNKQKFRTQRILIRRGVIVS